MDIDQGAPSNTELQAMSLNIDAEISRFQALIAIEDDKFLRYKVGRKALIGASLYHVYGQ